MRIELDNREKQLIHEYWYAASKDMQAQLLNMRRKTIDIAYEELQDLVGYLAQSVTIVEVKSWLPSLMNYVID